MYYPMPQQHQCYNTSSELHLFRFRCACACRTQQTSAFSGKVKLLTEAHRASITKEVETLNLSHYVSEIVDALAEAKLKTGDVGVAVHLCCMMHQR